MFKALADSWKATSAHKEKGPIVSEPKSLPPSTAKTLANLSNAPQSVWNSLKRVVPDRSVLANATSQLGKTRAAAVARRGIDVAQKTVVDATSNGAKFLQDKSQRGAQAVQKAAVDAAAKGVQALQSTTASAAATAKDSVSYVHRRTTKKAVDAGAALVDSSSAAFQQTKNILHASTENLRDPGKAARRLRNRVVLLVLSGVFVYGFASALPSALAKYAVERSKQQPPPRAHSSSTIDAR
ncbi:hypothetical protein H257_18306 [Aphanomyces astaci]|uniref:Uncharacterized protein n=1 Tax=Aphanomyces astaci TaxID=112090 RepID=W4FDG1_APHAT|nr:hypothetical protein H257_18306 [Aphanomyces astaci]ETV64876.1 hypothetical protein H257_18306 [Aphanomyces astaci]|eukprot:XP_009845642.1 hypothetical protein H257_18306 [Aphanomyces astaci]